MRYVLRVSVPDQPGALHALTGVCARHGVDIVSLDVIERDGGRAIDDLCVVGVDDRAALADGLGALPGTSVLSFRVVGSFRDTDGAVALAAALVAEGNGAVPYLVAQLPHALWTAWAVAVARGWSGLEMLAASDGALAPEHGGWLPLSGPRRLRADDVFTDERGDDLELAAAPLGQPTSAVLVARRGGPRFVERELRQLHLLARVAVATEIAHTPRRPLERIDPARRIEVRS